MYTFPKVGAKISTRFRDILICKWKRLAKIVAILSCAYFKTAE
jgi:hypothetical protein